MYFQHAGQKISQAIDLIGDTDKVIVNVPKINQVLRVPEREIMARELVENSPLRRYCASHVDQRPLQTKQSGHIVARGRLQKPILKSSDAIFDIVENREVTVDHEV